jgi:hypothetical protein
MHDYEVTAYGARGDGVTNDAAAIQKTIDACATAGGGRVTLGPGRAFLAGSFELKSNVEFRVERGARLLAATRQEDYPTTVFSSGPEADKRVWIKARDAQNVRLTGGGEIDGRCMEFVTGERPYIYDTLRWRPAMTCFVGCRGVRVDDITLRDAANWALHFTGCDDVLVHGVTILNNLKFPNCDGIDPDHCRNVRISDCHIEAGDDCIVLKNTPSFRDYGPTENVVVRGCTLVSTSCAIKIGSESVCDFRDIVFDSCVIRRSHRGLGIQLRDEGNVENVLYSNMIVETRLFGGGWWGAAEPIYVTALPRTADTKVGAIRHVRFRNLLCRGENGAYIRGCAASRPDDILLDNVRLELAKTSRHEGGFHDPRPCDRAALGHDEPAGEMTPWGQRVHGRTAGLWVQTAGRVTARDCEVVWGENCPPYFGEAIEARDVRDLRMERFQGQPAHPAPAPR